MIFHRCKSLIFQTFQNPLNLQKTHDSVRLLVLFYSSSKENLSDGTKEILNLLQKHDFSPRTASKVASSLSRWKNAQKCESILTFLKDVGFSAAQLEYILLKKPALLTSNLDEKIKPKIKTFQDLGFSNTDITVIFAGDPKIFSPSLRNVIVPSIMKLKLVLGSISEVAEVLKLYAGILVYDLDRTMLPNIDYLKSCGIRTDQIVKIFHSFPNFLLHKPENMKKFVEKAEEMGCLRHSRMLIYGVRAISSMSEESWKQKLGLFSELGFSEEQILAAFQKHPQAFAVSCQKIRKSVRLIIDNKNYDISDVFRYPGMFMYSLEKTLEPRLHVLDVLIRRNLLKEPPAFSVTYSISKQRFFDRYIVPYLGEVDEFRSLDDWRTEISKLNIVCS